MMIASISEEFDSRIQRCLSVVPPRGMPRSRIEDRAVLTIAFDVVTEWYTRTRSADIVKVFDKPLLSLLTGDKVQQRSMRLGHAVVANGDVDVLESLDFADNT